MVQAMLILQKLFDYLTKHTELRILRVRDRSSDDSNTRTL